MIPLCDKEENDKRSYSSIIATIAWLEILSISKEINIIFSHRAVDEDTYIHRCANNPLGFWLVIMLVLNSIGSI